MRGAGQQPGSALEQAPGLQPEPLLAGQPGAGPALGRGLAPEPARAQAQVSQEREGVGAAAGVAAAGVAAEAEAEKLMRWDRIAVESESLFGVLRVVRDCVGIESEFQTHDFTMPIDELSARHRHNLTRYGIRHTLDSATRLVTEPRRPNQGRQVIITHLVSRRTFCVCTCNTTHLTAGVDGYVM